MDDDEEKETLKKGLRYDTGLGRWGKMGDDEEKETLKKGQRYDTGLGRWGDPVIRSRVTT
jgi:hypothetical protein